MTVERDAFGQAAPAPAGSLCKRVLGGSVAGRGLRLVVAATDAVLRRMQGITEFESADDALLRIEFRRLGRTCRLSDGSRFRPGDPILELHIWNAHLPQPSDPASGRRTAVQIRQRLRRSLARLARHLQANPGLAVRGLRMRLPLASRRPGNALARILVSAGFEQTGPARGHTLLLRFLDSFWVWLLTRAYNPRALLGWRFERTRHEFWLSRTRFLALYGAP